MSSRGLKSSRQNGWPADTRKMKASTYCPDAEGLLGRLEAKTSFIDDYWRANAGVNTDEERRALED